MNIKTKAKYLDTALRIGKKGLTENIYAEIEKLLKKRKLVKIKILNNCPMDKDEIIRRVIEKTHSQLILKIGGVFVIFSP